MLWVWMIFLLLGCDEAGQAPQPSFEPPPAPPPAPSEPADVPAADQPFRWYVAAPDRDTASFGDGALHDHTAQHVVDAPRRFVARVVDGALEVVRENREQDEPAVAPAWTKTFAADVTGEPVIGSTMGSPLYAAARTARGYVIVAIDAESGEEAWRREHELEARGGVKLQLDFRGDEILVYMRGASDALHVLDANDGSLTARGRFGTEIRAPAPGAPPGASVGIEVGGRGGPDGAYRVLRRGEGMALERTAEPRWRTPIEPVQIFDDRLTVVEAGDHVVAISFCSGASGAYAFGLSPETGVIEWTSSVGSIGTIGHSRYANEVRAAPRGDRIVVYGEESSGSYVGVLDARAGRLVGWEVWRR